jgi:hypothetical protein
MAFSSWKTGAFRDLPICPILGNLLRTRYRVPRPATNADANSLLTSIGFALHTLETIKVPFNTDEEQLLVHQALVMVKEKMDLFNIKQTVNIP